MYDARSVSVYYVQNLIHCAESLHIPSSQLLAGLPITLEQLNNSKLRISLQVFQAIWQRALDLSGDTLLSLQMAKHSKPSSFNTLGYIMMNCATLEQALFYMLRYQRLVSDAGLLNLERMANGTVRLIYTEQLLTNPLFAQQIEAVLASIVAQARWLSRYHIIPLEVHFKHAAQQAISQYADFFGTEPCFNAPENSLLFSLQDLQAPLDHADEALLKLHCELADAQLAQLPSEQFISSFALHWLEGQVLGEVRISDLASRLGISIRSLQRQLESESSCWEDLLVTAKKQKICQLLAQSLTLEVIAIKLGYHDASSLSRAIQRWFGMSSKVLKAQLKADSGSGY